MKLILATVLCCAAIIGQISTASAYYYYGSPAGIYYLFAQPQQDLGWAYTRNQPVGDGKPYPAARMPDGTLVCEHSNYRPIRGWCRRIWRDGSSGPKPAPCSRAAIMQRLSTPPQQRIAIGV